MLINIRNSAVGRRLCITSLLRIGLAAIALVTFVAARGPKTSGHPNFADGPCYPICTYQGDSGRKYIGIGGAGTGCDDACDLARKKCEKDDTGCTKVGCTLTDCVSPAD